MHSQCSLDKNNCLLTGLQIHHHVPNFANWLKLNTSITKNEQALLLFLVTQQLGTPESIVEDAFSVILASIICMVLLLNYLGLSILCIFFRDASFFLLSIPAITVLFHPVLDLVVYRCDLQGLLNLFPFIREYRLMLSLRTFKKSLPVDADGGH